MSNRIVHGLDADTYHAGPELSNSGLGLLARSPWHWWSWHRAPHRPPSPQRAGQLEGTLLHCAVLEPDEFDRRYVVGPAVNRNTKVWKEFVESNPGRVSIQPDQRDAAFAQAGSVRALPDVAALLSRGHSEVSAYWTDPETGVACRCRPDWVHPVDDKRVILLDCKTYSDASKPEFSRQIARKGYARQDAFYSDGYAQAAGVEVIGFVFVAVETEWPYAAAAYMLDDESRGHGRAEYRRLVDLYAECDRTATWPAYSPSIEPISLPAWALKEM